MRRWRRSWPAATRSSAARSGSAWRPPVRGRCISSTVSTTPSSITSRWWPSLASRPAPGWAAATSRRSTSPRCSRTSATSTCTSRWTPAQIRHLIDRAMRIAAAERTPTCVIVPNDLQGADAVEDPPRAHGTLHSGIGDGYRPAPRHPAGAGPAARGRGPQRRRARGDPRRAGSPARRPRGRRGRRTAGGGGRQGPAGQGRAARRSAVGDRLDRAAGHQAQLAHDDGLRHAVDDRLELPLFGVPARGGPGPRRTDRPRRADARHPLPDGGQPGRRQRPDPAGPDAVARAQGRPLLAGEDRRRG